MTEPRNISPVELRLLVKQDARKGFEFIYSRYSSALYGILIRIVDDFKIAEDLLQDTFVKIWKNLDSYDDSKGTIFTWMLNIARNTGIDYLRSNQYKQWQQNKSSDAFDADGHSSVHNTDVIGIRQLALKLETKYRQVIELLYFKGHTQQEVAELLNIPLGTVKTRTRQALLTLRNQL
ncbi:MAG: sigma-70 family RNA polymerase sigma factor [Sphingobacteriales bacterium]|nr:sigma-70 family RNA polymerase sigma factor [Sphingobacteriales bacterium]